MTWFLEVNNHSALSLLLDSSSACQVTSPDLFSTLATAIPKVSWSSQSKLMMTIEPLPYFYGVYNGGGEGGHDNEGLEK